ncbi:amino acid ABC transporter permease [Actinokineospora xionganensis]|uniref:Amino acid ABC transporter permease n=1 Tax=Actinokineospora xionganensis TaxID=2684470 RepID=A0ABR7L8U2_9PSEU|nr:amino acid ABC transporter permease [Actinokineospora xionganensis]MBC6449100.1 amino acid ABC transporter permease [Actinokineospora xionganensis]
MADSSTTLAGPASGGARKLSPRKRRQLSLAAQSLVLVALLAILILTVDGSKIQKSFFDFKAAQNMFPALFTVALKNTIIYAVSAYVLGFVLGLILALMRLSSFAPYRWISLAYIEIFRGLPALLVLMIIGFGLPIAFDGLQFPLDPYDKVAIGLGLVAAAYMAETFRAGVQAVPPGQLEAARSLGMSHSRAMFSIVLPQAVRLVIPPLTNELIVLFKDSSLVSVIGITLAGRELTKLGSDEAIKVANSTPFVVAGATYLLITIPLGILVRRLEAKQRKSR